jgi:uracil-DNA glycosylase family 4
MRVENERKNGKIWLAGWGNDEARIMLIVSHPYQEDLRNGMLLGYDEEEGQYTARNEIDTALDAIGINIEEDCWVTSMVKYGIGSKEKPTAEQIEECAAELEEEIATVKPKLIVALGAEVFKRIMKQNIKQTDYLGEIIDCPYGKVLVNYSPSQVYRVDPKIRPEFIANFALAKRFVEDKLKYTDYEYLVVRDPNENKILVEQCIEDELFTVGYDLEWKGEFMKNEILYSFQYSVTPDRAIVLPLLSEKDKTTENIELLNTMKPLLEHPKIRRMGWNIRADDKRLFNKGFQLADETLAFDGMKAIAFFDSRWGKGLEFGIKKFTNYRPYYNKFNAALKKHKLAKEEMSDLLFLEPDLFFEYAAGDAVSHREACVCMMDEMKTLPFYVRKYYFDTYLPLTHYLMDMELAGIPIDLECMKKLTDQYTTCYEKLNDRLMDYTEKYGFNTVRYEESVKALGEEKTKELGFFEDFNPRSSKHKTKLFFEKLGLEPAYYVKKGKTKPKAWYDKQKDTVKAQYSPSANGKCIASLRFGLAEQVKKDPDNKELKDKYDVVKTYLNLARVGVFANKFFSTQGVDVGGKISPEDFSTDYDEEGESGEPLKSSYWAALGTDNKIHPDFYECLDNFRSSSRPNVQNPASKVLSHIPAIFKEFELEDPKNIRNIFYSGHKDWHFAEVDVAGADLAIAAFLSRDPEYIQDILAGGFHTTKMREYFKDPKLGKDDYSKYVTSKSITFRVAYTAGLLSAAMPIQAEIYAESGDLVDIELIKYALETWTRYSTYMQYRQDCQDEVEHKNQISNARGMVFKFEKTDNFSIKAGWMNQSLAYPIASELALFMWDISVKMKEQFKKDKIWLKYIYPVNVVHDANYWIIHKDLMKDMYFPELCKQYFTKDVKIATGDNLGMEMVVSDRWKGKEKVFAKETKWNTKTKSWDWDK